MKLIGCEHCGVILDQDKLRFARDMYLEDEMGFSLDERVADWDPNLRENNFFVLCPVCEEKVFKQ